MKHAIRVGRQRLRRRLRVRRRLKQHLTRPRLSVFRSHRHIYAQIIDDAAGRTVAAASSLEKQFRDQIGYGGNRAAATVVGRTIAQRALAAGVRQAALDRREYKYHGRVAALADAARDAGLDLGPKQVSEPPPETQAKTAPAKKQKKEASQDKPQPAKGKKKADASDKQQPAPKQ